MTIFMSFSGVMISTNLIRALDNQLVFSYTLVLMGVVALGLFVAGLCLHLEPSSLHFTSGMTGAKRKLKLALYVFVFMTICLAALERFPSLTGYNVFNWHPIDQLIVIAKSQHKVWTDQAVKSKDLGSAITEYKRRYNREPPPQFDVWYKYAVDRSSAIIDDFDSIHDDLAPFWALSPLELRVRTKQAVFERWNEVVEIRIRSGQAFVPDMIPTHRWMIEGVVHMIQPFIEHIPDMDVAFNINDEPRVAVPFDKLQRLRGTRPSETPGPKSNLWTYDRKASFDSLSNQSSYGLFENWSFRENFQKYGSLACPSNSPAKRTRSWDWSRLCVSCFEPHSLGHFVRDWKLSASPCHQPDLVNLHGFYKSAAAFKTTKTLLPIFSQSKVAGYSDILYPTAWNYNDKIKYAPSSTRPDIPWSEKHETLFWRGSTSEGFSGFGAWRSMVRQRLTFLNNNSTQSLPVFLPVSQQAPNHYTYQHLTKKQFINRPSLRASNLSLDTRLIDITRCGFGDCQRETAQFGNASELQLSIHFREHWRYKYLLDMDGAGFSGRFLPFLQSHSLPFKAALFREWYDSRITAWLHFVPIDLRLHGLWSTLAYFAGGFGEKLQGTSSDSAIEPGEWIAEEGRRWAEKALRKEDMEIYFFRLLLEWGRLTDDRRDSLGV